MTISRYALLALAGASLLWVSPSFAWTEGVSADMNHALLERCNTCHDLERVESALKQGRSLDEIQTAMNAQGATLSAKEKETLGTFWGEASGVKPAQENTPIAEPVTAQQAAEFDRVIKQRCLGCHTRERIDDAIAKQLPFEPIEQMMLKRGAVLNPNEQEVLKIFWEQPHR